MAGMRLDKYLANALGLTRTQVKALLKKKNVQVNGATVQKPEQKIDVEKDQITCSGQPVVWEEFRYFMLNKPAGCVSATRDNHQKVVLDYLEEPSKEELFPVGRLDIDTVGLLLLTNDGALAHELLSPRKHVDKTYFAQIRGQVTEEDVKRFQEGLDIGEEKPTLPAELKLCAPPKRIDTSSMEGTVSADEASGAATQRTGEVSGTATQKTGEASGAATQKTGEVSGTAVQKTGEETGAAVQRTYGKLSQNQPEWYTEIQVTIREGKFHQVKRMFEAVGKEVVYLKRLSMGSLQLDPKLNEGEYRRLTEEELENLKKHGKCR